MIQPNKSQPIKSQPIKGRQIRVTTLVWHWADLRIYVRSSYLFTIFSNPFSPDVIILLLCSLSYPELASFSVYLFTISSFTLWGRSMLVFLSLLILGSGKQFYKKKSNERREKERKKKKERKSVITMVGIWPLNQKKKLWNALQGRRVSTRVTL